MAKNKNNRFKSKSTNPINKKATTKTKAKNKTKPVKITTAKVMMFNITACCMLIFESISKLHYY